MGKRTRLINKGISGIWRFTFIFLTQKARAKEKLTQIPFSFSHLKTALKFAWKTEMANSPCEFDAQIVNNPSSEAESQLSSLVYGSLLSSHFFLLLLRAKIYFNFRNSISFMWIEFTLLEMYLESDRFH